MSEIHNEDDTEIRIKTDETMSSVSTMQDLSKKFENLTTDELGGRAKALDLLNRQDILIKDLKEALLKKDEENKILREKENKLKNNEVIIKKSVLNSVPLGTSMSESELIKKYPDDDFNWVNEKETEKDKMYNNIKKWKTKKILTDEGINDDYISQYKINNCTKEPKMSNMNSQQSCFSGELNENIDNWLFEVNINMASSNTPEDRKLLRAAGYLRGTALQTFKLIVNENKNITWDECQEELRKAYRAEDHEDNVLIEMGLLKQTGTIREYVNKFKYLANQVYGESERVKIMQFVNNLDIYLGKEIKYKKPKTLHEAMQIAIDYEMSGKGTPINSITDINRIERVENRICYYCNKRGHLKSNCFQRKREVEVQQPERNRFQRQQPVKQFFQKEQLHSNTKNDDIKPRYQQNNNQFNRPYYQQQPYNQQH